MSIAPLPGSGDPFPEAVDAVLAAAIAGETLGPDDAEDPEGVLPEVSAGELAALWRDVDATLLVEATVPTSDWSDAQVVDALAAAERSARAATARGLRLAAELAARRPEVSTESGEEGLSRYAVDEVAVAARLARGAARARVAEGQALAGRHPRLLAALEAGLVAAAGVRKVAELCWPLGAESARRVEAAVLDALGRPLVPGLGSMDLAGMYAVDPDLTQSVAARATTVRLARLTRDVILVQRPRRERSMRARELAARRVSLELAEAGMAWLSIYGPEALALAAFEKLTGHALDLPPEDDRGLDARRADAALDLILGVADHPPGAPSPAPSVADADAGSSCDAASSVGPGQSSAVPPAGGWGAATVNLEVIVDHSRCPGPDGFGGRGGAGAGCVGEAGRLGPVTAASLAGLLGLTLDAGGTVTGGHALPVPCPGAEAHEAFGPGPYEPSAALRRLMRGRWRECVFPGCSRPARRCHLDHTRPHREGGPTCECNLAPQCELHHLLKHHPGPGGGPPWRLVRDSDLLTWISPTGIRVHVTPDPPDPPPVVYDPPPY